MTMESIISNRIGPKPRNSEKVEGKLHFIHIGHDYQGAQTYMLPFLTAQLEYWKSRTIASEAKATIIRLSEPSQRHYNVKAKLHQNMTISYRNLATCKSTITHLFYHGTSISVKCVRVFARTDTD